MRFVCLLAIALTLSAALPDELRAEGAPAAPPTRAAVHAARLLDVESGGIVSDPMVLVEGDKIVSVSAGGSAPAGMQAGDPLADVTVLEHAGFVMKGGRVLRGAGQP